MKAHEHSQDDHAHAEAFPRIETVELVGHELASAKRREWLICALVGVGVTLIALGLPSETLIGRGWRLVEATSRGEWLGPHLVPCALARMLTSFGLESERAWFLLSAMGLGASASALMFAARMSGFSMGVALAALGVALTTPIASLSGTTPGALSFALLGAALLIAAMRTSDEGPITVAWCVAMLANAFNFWLWPAVFWAASRAQHKRSVFWPLIALFAAAAVGVALDRVLGLEFFPREPPEDSDMFAGRGSVAVWALLLVPALGLLGVGPFGWLVARFQERERLAGPLIAIALCGPLTLMLTDSDEYPVGFAWAVPVCALGVFAPLPRSGRRGFVLVVVATILALATNGFLLHLHRGPRGTLEWPTAARRQLEPSDVLFTVSEQSAYLARERFHIEAHTITSIADAIAAHDDARARGRRPVLDSACVRDPACADLVAARAWHVLRVR